MTEKIRLAIEAFKARKDRNASKMHKTDSFRPTNPPICPTFFLQRTIGNRSVRFIQSKPRISQPNDKYEQEADRVADALTHSPIANTPVRQSSSVLQFKKAPDYQSIYVQRKDESKSKSESSLPSAIKEKLKEKTEVSSAGGFPLSEAERTFFEHRFGCDFGKVRIHTNTRAATAAQALNARAFTIGHNVVFGAGQYSPATAEGKKLIGHELAHVVQQGAANHVQPKAKGLSSSTKIFHKLYHPRIQCWGLSDHEKLTESSVKQFMSSFEGFKMDKTSLEALKTYSTEMDRRLGAICFNLPAVLIGSHEKLVKHYEANREEAENHGEGGLYKYDASQARKNNLKKQAAYENKARESWRLSQREFKSLDECWRTKSNSRENALSALGYALHVAQDRGAHGEGAIGEGHDKSNFKPDDPSVNKEGWRHAQQNTELVILQAFDILYKILDEKWSRTCSYTTPAIVTKIEK